MKKAYRMVFFSDESREAAIERVREELAAIPEVQHFVKFLLESLSDTEHKRGFLRPGKLDESEDDEAVF